MDNERSGNSRNSIHPAQQRLPDTSNPDDNSLIDDNISISIGNNNNTAPSSSISTVDKSEATLAAGQASNSKQATQQSQNLKPKPITHRSQSSPSSLTTHKFGLRPTPSPPRLIIDHQTGDIIESYPEQPVYLRTYQPLDDNSNQTIDNNNNTSISNDITSTGLDDDVDDLDFSNTSNTLELDSSHPQISSSAAIAAAKGLPAAFHRGDLNQHQEQQLYLPSDNDSPTTTMGHNSRQRGGGFIPPPHAGASKVYFAPPMASGGHLFHHDDYDDRERGFSSQPPFVDEDPISRRNRERDRLQMNHHHSSPQPILQQQQQQPVNEDAHAALQNTFKRAISKLSESSPKATTDIALVTHPDAESSKNSEIKIMTTPKQTAAAAAGSNRTINNSAGKTGTAPAPRATAADGKQAAKVRYLSTTAEDNKLANQRIIDHDPSVESFGLYSFCYLFRILLTIFLSSLIIYLLVASLHADCTKYRPTYTYVSLIIASVNLICLVIFTLFWYCSGVTRTLYSNLSSSAFIVTIYSILVAINLAIAIIFFLIGTCHFQRLINTPAQSHSLSAAPATASPLDGPTLDDLAAEALRAAAANDFDHSRFARSYMARSNLAADDNDDDDNNNNNRSQDGSDDDADRRPASPRQSNTQQTTQPEAAAPSSLLVLADANEGQQIDSEGHVFGPSSYTMSPWEAGWEYTKEQAWLAWRAFHRFLLHYDLRFIGALHALCAICFQYLAIKVAVVRSYFCYSPVEGGDYV